MTNLIHNLIKFPDVSHHNGPKCGLVPHLMGRAWFRFFGWELEGRLPLGEQFLLIGAPHTSNWDLPFTLASVYYSRLSISWLGKDSLFKGVFGPFFRWLGGIPVDRSTPTGAVSQIASLFGRSQKLAIAISPPGTRSKKEHWRSGFYHIAREAQIPIVCGALDFANRKAILGDAFVPTGDMDQDMARIRAFYEGIKGKHPERTTPVRLKASLSNLSK